MTDVQDTAVKRSQAPRDVNYTLDILEGDLPDLEVQRRSPLEDQIDKIVATPDAHGKWVRIASYAKGSAGSAAANVLRKRHGDKPAVEGFTFRTKRADEDGTPRTGLFVKYEPSKIVEGAKAEFDQRMKDRQAELAAAAEKRKAAGNGATGATEQTPREQKQGPGQTSGSADAAKAKAPASKQ